MDRTTIGPLMAGAVVGAGLGLAIGYFGRAPLFGTTVIGYVLIPLAIGVLAVAVLGWRAARSGPGSRSAGLALAALFVAGVAGVAVPQEPIGALVHRPGSVVIGNDASPTAYLQAPATCSWVQGGPYVSFIDDFSLHVDYPTLGSQALQTAFDVDSPVDFVRIFLGTGYLPIGDANLEFAEGQSSRNGSFTPLPMAKVAPDGRGGTARSPDGALVVSWACSTGPNG